MTKKTLLTFAFLVLTGSLTTLYGAQLPKKQKISGYDILVSGIIKKVDLELQKDTESYTVCDSEKFWETQFSYLYGSPDHSLCLMIATILDKKKQGYAENSHKEAALTMLITVFLHKHTENSCKQCKQIIAQLQTNNTPKKENSKGKPDEDKTND